jgi:hypothetical protein
MVGVRGVHHGKSFEALATFQARIQGYLMVQHGSMVKRLSPTRMIALKSDLDFRICHPDGRIVFADTKSFQGSHATMSQYTTHQLERCDLYAKFGQTAGMLVLLRGCDAVVFYSIQNIRERAKGSRFTPDNGLHLGRAAQFSYAPLFALGEDASQ